MSLIEGVGDEVTHFFIVLFVIIFVTVAWWTTNITEQRHFRLHTVFLINRRSAVEQWRRRRRTHGRLSNHTESTTLVEAATDNMETDSISASAELPETSEENANKPSTSEQSAPCNAQEEEQTAIVDTMDAVNCILRERRTVFLDNLHTSNIQEIANGNENMDANNSSSSDTDEQVLMEQHYGDKTGIVESMPEDKPTDEDPSLIHIKLKYINDDLKVVDGSLQEPLGDFKRRHFEEELSSNKLVRLIFNGKVLQEDAKTLRGCGLFDNCVVHCLVHQKRPISNESNVQDNSNFRRGSRTRASNNNNNQPRESDLGNILFALISFILGSAWYFRYVYAHLYTITATVALVAVTGIFTIVIIGMYFPDQDSAPPPPSPPNTENSQR